VREMKDSGVVWIGEIPQEWSLKRLRFLCNITTGNMDTQDNDPEGQYPFYVRSPIVEHSNNYTFDNEAVLMAGDGVGAGKVFHYVNGKYGCHQRVYSMSDFNEVVGKYLYYYLQENFYKKIEESNAKSTVDSVRLPMLKDFPVVFPDVYQQKEIVSYLNSKCANIDEVIKKQQAIIKKLKEYKLSFITESVIRGLNHECQMKDSGIDYIGLIPAHWHQCRLRNIGGAQNGISKGAEYFGEGFPFVSYGDIYRNYSLPYEVQGRVRTTAEEQEHYSVEAGDIFFTRTSETIDEVGFSCVCEKTIPMATYAGFVIRVRPYNNVLYTGYAKYYFRSSHHRSYLAKEMNLVTRASLGQDLLKSMPVLVPPKEEQKAIASFLDKKCDEIDRFISQKEGLINKLIDYKKSMIYEIVTGKKGSALK